VAAYHFFDNDLIHSACLLNDQDAPDKPRLNDVLRLVARLGDALAGKATANPASRPSGLA
jgi:hypothetical protein